MSHNMQQSNAEFILSGGAGIYRIHSFDLNDVVLEGRNSYGSLYSMYLQPIIKEITGKIEIVLSEEEFQSLPSLRSSSEGCILVTSFANETRLEVVFTSVCHSVHSDIHVYDIAYVANGASCQSPSAGHREAITNDVIIDFVAQPPASRRSTDAFRDAESITGFILDSFDVPRGLGALETERASPRRRRNIVIPSDNPLF